MTGQQLDLRRVNSWLLLLDQIDPSELLEVFAINALAPFIINSRLKRLMLVDPTGAKYIINVSAMEGKLYDLTIADLIHFCCILNRTLPPPPALGQ